MTCRICTDLVEQLGKVIDELTPEQKKELRVSMLERSDKAILAHYQVEARPMSDLLGLPNATDLIQ